MNRSSPSEEFWSQDTQVAAFSANTKVLIYERDLMTRGIAAAAVSGVTQEVHAVGVGAGRELPAIRALLPVAKIHAWDVAEPMVQACEALIQAQGMTNLSVGQADITELGKHRPHADLVVLLNAVLCYVTSLKEQLCAFEALHSLLRPGGTIAAVVHQRNGRPDWALWFAARSLLSACSLVKGSAGDRKISHGNSTMLFHHFTLKEVGSLLSTVGFEQVSMSSLRQWSKSSGHKIPLNSPNPLLVTAVRS
ncbi:MAG: class I SAM-dependent methyltransferase [Microthrixaceae bacterium]